ncbi:PLP-dependent aminotransferase family protein [Saccharothrix sp. S26]|uniref:aminotransferase-like domain-containing protein n=1 Tax=Saccharothrix sp. S26 TaxID=2907215 RepID=UPI001F2BC15A|nr:PLP-dependent aminotransferase family protein [Saccharothrix sp. S26]MCE6995087.1 PLP-dependent aminotransferase family protein [Saccharothrix sp. S26]
MNRSKPGSVERSTTAGSDFLQLDVGEAPAGGRADWLTGRLREAIADGRLPVGSRLPPTRVLAAELRVSRGVVTEAYQRLAEDGHVTGRGRAGTVVVAAPHAVTPLAGEVVGDRSGGARGAAGGGAGGARAAAGLSGVGGGSGGAPGMAGLVGGARRTGGGSTGAGSSGGTRGSAGLSGGRSGGGFGRLFARPLGAGAFDALRAAPARIDLSPGVPDVAAFPRAAWLRAERAVLSTLSSVDFGYGDPRGTPALRRAVAGWLARYRGVLVEPDEVVIVAGVAQALGLLAQVLRRDGVTEVAVEDPGSLGARQHLRNWDLGTPPVPVDGEGVRVDALRAGGAAAVLVTPAHQFPTGVVLSGGRRRELMRWADAGGLVIEDDYDAEHRYDRPPVPALRAMLPERVCYAGSVSKVLAPALRVGWLIAPSAYHDRVVEAKRYADLGNAVLPQLVLAELMGSGELERHLRFVRRRHRRRRDTMVQAIARHLPGAVVHGAAAGLHLLITFDDSVSDVDLAAAALERGVKAQPLSWHAQEPGRPGLVLGYGASSPTDVAEGVAVIADALRQS